MAGRPSKYTEELSIQAERLSKLGCTDKEISTYFNVALSTLNKWKVEFSEFSEAIKRGRLTADAEVAHKLFDRAVGAIVFKQQAIKLKDTIYDNGKKISETERVEIVDLSFEEPPDTAALIFWLTNRQRSKWRRNGEMPSDTDELLKKAQLSKLEKEAGGGEKASSNVMLVPNSENVDDWEATATRQQTNLLSKK